MYKKNLKLKLNEKKNQEIIKSLENQLNQAEQAIEELGEQAN